MSWERKDWRREAEQETSKRRTKTVRTQKAKVGSKRWQKTINKNIMKDHFMQYEVVT